MVLTAGANNAGFTYLWDNLSTAGSRTINQNGTYYVLKTEIASGCAGTDTFQLSLIPAPSVSLGPDTAICEGSSTTLDVGSINYTHTILWDDNSTNVTRDVDTVGVYTVRVTAPNGCYATDDIHVTFRDEPFIDGINKILMLDGSYNFNLKQPQYVSMPIWDYGDGSPRDTGWQTSHRYLKNGLYKVTVYLIGDCHTDSTELKSYYETLDVFDANTSVAELEGVLLKLYPNPAQDKVTISSEGATIKGLQLYNILGQRVAIEEVVAGSQVDMKTTHLVSGVYHLIIETSKGNINRKLEILR